MLQAQGTNQLFMHTVRTRAQPRAVWRLWTEVAGWPRWDTELEWARLDTPFVPGGGGMLKPRGGPAARFTLTVVQARQAYTMRTPLPGGALIIERFQMRGAFTHRVRFEGVLGGVFAEMMGPGFRRALPQAMQRLSALAEAGA